MDTSLFEKTKVAAYFLWEYTQCGNALALWYCAEDIALYLEQRKIESLNDIKAIVKKGKLDSEYIDFIRNIAFRIFVYTNNMNELTNWFAAERLILCGEWSDAMMDLVRLYCLCKKDSSNLNAIFSKTVRDYYKSF